MGSEPLSRKLAAILYADVAGYSRLTGQDEDGTHRQLSASLDLISNAIRGYRGRVVHYAGDAVLADFDTVSDAISCAAAVQRDLAEHNGELNDDQKVQFRIGVNLGEVIVDREDIYGDGVNVAARLEALAEPGGICVSEAVRTAIGNKLPLEFEFMGEQRVKNIADPVRAYHVRLEPDARLPEPQVSPLRKNRRLKTIPATAVVVILVTAVAGVTWWQPWAPDPEPASLEDTAFPLPDRPSIAVLPFDNLSGDSAQEYFADGMTDDLITDLSRISGLFVIARNSSFTYKGKPTDARRAARELGVRYVLEGSVRRSGDQVRINAQLIDGKDGGHLWAQRYDGPINDVFAVQDKVTQKIVAALALNLKNEEQKGLARGIPTSVAAYDAYLQGWAHYKLQTPDDLVSALGLFEEALKLDPDYYQAHAALAAVYFGLWHNSWVERIGKTPFRAYSKANEHLREAMRQPNALAYWLSSKMLASKGAYNEAVTEAEKAVQLEPSEPTGYSALANALVLAGKPVDGIKNIGKAMRLDPYNPTGYLIILGQAQFSMSDFNSAAVTFERVTRRNPENEWAWVYLASTYGHLGRIKEGVFAVETFDTLRVQAGLASFTLEYVNHWRFGRDSDRARVRVGLAALPEPEWKALVERGPSGYSVKFVQEIDASTAGKLHDRGVLFLDVRSNHSRRTEGFIPKSVHIESSQLTKARLEMLSSMDREVVFYCGGRDCPLSAEASAKAHTWGYKHVFYFGDGFPGWIAAGYPVKKFGDVPAADTIKKKTSLAIPDKPSIAVLPFTNLSGDPAQEYFADGMTDDLITDLSKIDGLFIISRNSSFAYKGKSSDVRQVSRELGVRYVLEGSVRRSGDQVRINAQLLDAATGGHMWAERYDRSLDDVFKLQDEVTKKIVTALAINLSAADQTQMGNRGTRNTAAYEEFLRGWEHYRRGTAEQYARAVDRFNKALSLDPEFARAHAAMASVFFKSWREGWHKFLDLQGFEAWRLTKQHLANAMRAPTGLAH